MKVKKAKKKSKTKKILLVICIILLCSGAFALRQAYNKKYGKVVLAYKIKKSDRSKYHYEDENVSLSFTKVEQRGETGRIVMLYMTCRNKTGGAKIPGELVGNLMNVQYNKEYKQDVSPGIFYQNTVSKLFHPTVVSPAKYLVQPGETVKSYMSLLLDDPGQPFRIVKKDELYTDKKNKVNFKFRTTGKVKPVKNLITD